jgi:hypothetical protein
MEQIRPLFFKDWIKLARDERKNRTAQENSFLQDKSVGSEPEEVIAAIFDGPQVLGVSNSIIDDLLPAAREDSKHLKSLPSLGLRHVGEAKPKSPFRSIRQMLCPCAQGASWL